MKPGQKVKAVPLKPQVIYRSNIQDVIKGGGTSAQQICVKALTKACAQYGIS